MILCYVEPCSAVVHTSASLRPERGIQLTVGQQTILQAGQEGQQMAALGEVYGGALYSILAHQNDSAPCVSCQTHNTLFYMHQVAWQGGK